MAPTTTHSTRDEYSLCDHSLCMKAHLCQSVRWWRCWVQLPWGGVASAGGSGLGRLPLNATRLRPAAPLGRADQRRPAMGGSAMIRAEPSLCSAASARLSAHAPISTRPHRRSQHSSPSLIRRHWVSQPLTPQLSDVVHPRLAGHRRPSFQMHLSRLASAGGSAASSPVKAMQRTKSMRHQPAKPMH